MSGWARGRGIALSVAMLAAAIFGETKPLAADTSFADIGRPPSAELLKAWDIDVAPNGDGAPPGQGTVADGEAIYFEQCASCHGDFGEGIGNIPPMMGGKDTLRNERPVKTVGSYWPFATTLFDYIKRTMPFQNPQSLSDDQVYALTAYLLYLNDIAADDLVLGPDNIAGVVMPAAGIFFDDPRPDAQPDGPPCMHDCPGGDVTGRAREY